MRPTPLAVVWLLVLSLPGAASASDAELREAPRAPERAGILPDHVKLQLAGNIGFVSPGLGESWRDGAVQADLFVGHVPESRGGPVTSVTGKVTARPFLLEAGAVQVRPLTVALQLTYAIGERFFLRQPEHYPDGYYPVPTALHADVAVGAAVSWPGRRPAERLGLYAEFTAADRALLNWARNPDELGAADVFSLAVGVAVEFDG